jgi:uncharacterized membrane protein
MAVPEPERDEYAWRLEIGIGQTGGIMGKERLAAFSDGVIAIIITIMVLELKIPDGADWGALRSIAPHFVAYVLSFVYMAIYWNNRHHLLHTVERVDGAILWANALYVLVAAIWLVPDPRIARAVRETGDEE